MKASNKYDYIIAGAGCAGLSLLYRLLQDATLQQKRILVIDKVRKESDDRTWCFWEKDQGPFEDIVKLSWDKLLICSDDFQTVPDLAPYRYKMIAGIDFYTYIRGLTARFPLVEFRYEPVTGMRVTGKKVICKTKDAVYEADYLFNSTSFCQPKRRRRQLLHFRGWKIKTDKDYFDLSTPVLMDFRVPQYDGAAFMYLLPLSPNTALIEYTLIGRQTVKLGNYAAAIVAYLRDVLRIEKYELTGEEGGALPLYCRHFPPHHRHRIVHIGNAAGCLKPSSGYAFQAIQQHCDAIVERLSNNQSPAVKNQQSKWRFRWYDSILLDVIHRKRYSFATIMKLLFMNVPVVTILQFLENKTRLEDELKLFSLFPPAHFLPAAFRVIFRRY